MWEQRHMSIFACNGDRPQTDITFVMKTPSPEVAQHIVELHNNNLLVQQRNARRKSTKP
jgi:hypothetical protein